SGGASESRESTSKAGWKAEAKSVPGGTTTASIGPAPAPKPASTVKAGSTDGKPTGPTTTADATGAGPLKAPASMAKIADKMLPDERAALDAGYETARKTKGFTGSPEDFFAEQVALYKHAPEGDPRILTWFYGDTLEAVEQDPASKEHVAKVVAQQQADAADASHAALPPG